MVQNTNTLLYMRSNRKTEVGMAKITQNPLTHDEMWEQKYKQLQEIEYQKQFSFENKVQQEYAKFCMWCRAFKNGEFTEENFKEYQKQENTKFDFWLKKAIAEQYFDYEFEFDYNTMKWSSHKKKQ